MSNYKIPVFILSSFLLLLLPQSLDTSPKLCPTAPTPPTPSLSFLVLLQHPALLFFLLALMKELDFDILWSWGWGSCLLVWPQDFTPWSSLGWPITLPCWAPQSSFLPSLFPSSLEGVKYPHATLSSSWTYLSSYHESCSLFILYYYYVILKSEWWLE